jgi:hypothetical protein
LISNLAPSENLIRWPANTTFVVLERLDINTAVEAMIDCVRRLRTSPAPESREIGEMAENALSSLAAAVVDHDVRFQLWGELRIPPAPDANRDLEPQAG